MIAGIIIGTILGIIAGLMPGLHTNNIALMLILLPIADEELVTIILTLAIVQTFVEFIPATFLGAPTANTFEGVLPAHKMFLEGKALEAIMLSIYGGIIGTVLSVFLAPLFFLFIEKNSKEIILVTPLILIFAIIIMVNSENTARKKVIALLIVIGAATQGMFFKDQLFPLITGYFGLATLLYSLKEKNKYVKQEEKINVKCNYLQTGIGAFGGTIVALMPGIGTNTAAGIIRTFQNKINGKDYLSMIGAINISNFFFGYAALFALGKTRNGAMVAMQNKIMTTQEQLIFGIIIMIIATGIGAISTIILSKKAIHLFNEKRTITLTKISIMIMILLVGLFNGATGIICLVFSTSLGLITNTQKVKRSLCMSALIVPTLFFYLFILI